MGRVDPRRGGQLRASGERLIQLFGATLEQAPAARGKQRIAAKQQVLRQIGNMIQRMAWNLHYREFRKARGRSAALAFAQPPVDSPYVAARRSVNRCPVTMPEHAQAAHMVGVMVGYKNRGELHPLGGQPAFHGIRVAGIDHDGPIAFAQGPDVVVAECLERDDLQHVNNIILSGAPKRLDRRFKPATGAGYNADTFSGISSGNSMRTGKEDSGQSRSQAEARAVQEALASLAGRVAVQIGTCACSGVPRERFVEAYCLDTEGDNLSLRARPELLPLMSESVDLVLMLHSLDRPGPRGAWLAEAARVLRPEGRLAVVGNRVWRSEWLRGQAPPLGLWRLRLLIGRYGLSWDYARGLKGITGTYLAVARRRLPGVIGPLRPAWVKRRKVRHSLEVPGTGNAG